MSKGIEFNDNIEQLYDRYVDTVDPLLGEGFSAREVCAALVYVASSVSMNEDTEAGRNALARYLRDAAAQIEVND